MTSLKFAHLADLHLGAFREKTLTELNFKTFQKAIEKIILEEVDFCLFAGDIFNSAMPPLDLVQKVVKELMKLKSHDIPLYVIGGSHDYSLTGKSFIHLLDSAGVFIDVAKWKTVDKNSVELEFTKNEEFKVCLSGILGKKNGLDKNVYKNLNENSLDKNYFNIFLFHTTLNDYKPEFMRAVQTEVNSNFLPKGFDYYAGGHVHTFIDGKYGDGRLCYPGPLFPNSFSELKRERATFLLCSFDFETRVVDVKREFLETYEKESVRIEINDLTPLDSREFIEKQLINYNVKNKLVLLEIFGTVEGKISDIKLNETISHLYEKGALHVLKHTYNLKSSLLEEMELNIEEKSGEDIESEVLEILLKEISNEEKEMFSKLFSLNLSKQEDETNPQFETRIIETFEKTLNS